MVSSSSAIRGGFDAGAPLAIEEIPSEMTAAEAVAVAVRFHRAGEVKVARRLYERILEAVPDHGDALHFLGVARHCQLESSGSITFATV